MSQDKSSIRTETNNDVVIKLVDTAGTNVAAVSAANALKVDGSAVTQPVSGTVTATNASVGATGAAAPASATEAGLVFNTTPATLTNGQLGALQGDSGQNLLVKVNTALPTGTNVIGALTANQSVNTAQVNAVTVLTGTGATGTGSQRVTVAVDSATVAGSASLPAGTNGIGKLTANTGVIIGDVNVVSNIPGTTATSLGKAEDAVHTSGDTGVMSLGVRNSTNATLTSADGDYSPIAVDLKGAVGINDAGNSITVDAVALDVRTITKATDSIQISANTTANSSTNPIFVNVTEGSGSVAKATYAETAALAAQASATLSGAVLTASKTGTFNKATISSEVPFKAVIQSLDEAAATVTMATLYGDAGSVQVFEPKNVAALFQVVSDGTPTAKFQIVVTNNNASGIGSSGIIAATIEFDEA